MVHKQSQRNGDGLQGIAAKGGKRISRAMLTYFLKWSQVPSDDVGWKEGLKWEITADLGVPYGCQMWGMGRGY